MGVSARGPAAAVWAEGSAPVVLVSRALDGAQSLRGQPGKRPVNSRQGKRCELQCGVSVCRWREGSPKLVGREEPAGQGIKRRWVPGGLLQAPGAEQPAGSFRRNSLGPGLGMPAKMTTDSSAFGTSGLWLPLLSDPLTAEEESVCSAHHTSKNPA